MRELAEFRPTHGVISVFVDLDPANRGDAWRIRMRDALDEAVGDRRGERDVKATIERINDRFRGYAEQRETGRYVIGFLEVAAKGGRDEWFELQAPPVETAAYLADRPFLPPLIKLLDQAPVTGVAALSSERVEVCEWRFGIVEPVESLHFDREDTGRERKAPMVNAALGTATSSSGKDQFNQRLEDEHKRFLASAGERFGEIAQSRGWQKLLCFGSEAAYRAFVAKLPEPLPRLAGGNDLVNSPNGELARVTTESIAAWEAERERAIVERATSAALARDGRGAVGVAEVSDCLAAGRVDHLVYDSARDFNGELDELLSQALATGARITPVEGDRAAALAEHEGVAAILRY